MLFLRNTIYYLSHAISSFDTKKIRLSPRLGGLSSCCGLCIAVFREQHARGEVDSESMYIGYGTCCVLAYIQDISAWEL